MLVIFQWLWIGMYAMVHPFFISMTEVNYNASSKTLEVSVRIFADDFEKALANSCHCKVDLSQPVSNANTHKIVGEYITRRLIISIDGKPAVLQFQGYQQEDGSTWNYFEVKNVASLTKLDVNNNLLYEYNNSQVNMVHAKANGREQTDKLEYPDRVLGWSF